MNEDKPQILKYIRFVDFKLIKEIDLMRKKELKFVIRYKVLLGIIYNISKWVGDLDVIIWVYLNLYIELLYIFYLFKIWF